MTVTRNLVGSGFSGGQTQAVLGNPSVGLSGAGTSSLANALAAPSDFMVFSTVASNSGVRLPTFNAATGPAYGDAYTVINEGANALLVYPGTATGTVQAGSAGQGFSLAANKAATFFYKGLDKWAAILSA